MFLDGVYLVVTAQSDVVKFLAKHEIELGSFASRTVMDLGFVTVSGYT